MRHLNYNHLLYFWTVAREGSIAKASTILHLTPQTISGQLKLLEESVGEPLFNRVGRGLVLSETGHVVNQYADEIFSLGAELASRVQNKTASAPLTLNVGIVNSIPKLIAYRIIEPALKMDSSIRTICHEGNLEQLLSDLAIHKLDIVISDRPIPTGLNVKAYNHALGNSSISFFCAEKNAHKYNGNFPDILDAVPMLMPFSSNPLRRQLEDWFSEQKISPLIIAEFDDSALLKAFGAAGKGLFPAPTSISDEIEHMYHAVNIGTIPDLSENYFAISPERKVRHPAVLLITESARQHLSG